MLKANGCLQLAQRPARLWGVFAREQPGPQPVLDVLVGLGTVKAQEQPIDRLLVNVLTRLGILLPFGAQLDAAVLVNAGNWKIFEKSV